MRFQKYYKNDLEKVISLCINWSEVCRYYNLPTKGGSPGHMKSRADKFNINYSHFTGKPRISKGGSYKKLTVNEYINSSSITNSYKLKLKLIEEGIKKQSCEICNLSEWNNKKIPLELDHIDGNYLNNNLDNLRILCKNCHAQTDTYGVKNIKKKNINVDNICVKCNGNKSLNAKYCINCKEYKKKIIKKNNCIDCSVDITPKSKRCKTCNNKIILNHKSNIPSFEELNELIWKFPMVKIKEFYNVSNVTIKKWCKKLNINTPPIGFWTKGILRYNVIRMSLRKIGEEGTSWCSICQDFLDNNLFGNNKYRWNGYNSLCKNCNNERMREFRKLKKLDMVL